MFQEVYILVACIIDGPIVVSFALFLLLRVLEGCSKRYNPSKHTVHLVASAFRGVFGPPPPPYWTTTILTMPEEELEMVSLWPFPEALDGCLTRSTVWWATAIS
jgi:hypothetical protein